jgi:hypothetical protein
MFLGTLLAGRSSRQIILSTSSPPDKQPSVLGGWLNLSILHFRSKLRSAVASGLEGLSPPDTHNFSERTTSKHSTFLVAEKT